MEPGADPDPLVFAAALLGMVVFGGLFAAYLLRQLKQEGARASAAWRGVASRLGGRFRDGEGGLTTHPCSISWPGEPDGTAEVVLDFVRARSGNATVTCTRATASVGTSVRLRLSPEDLFTRLGQGIGVRDAATGDRDFDEAFRIDTDDEPRLTRLLTPPVRQALLAVRSTTFDVDDGKVTAMRRGLLIDADEIEPLVVATRALAGSLRG